MKHQFESTARREWGSATYAKFGTELRPNLIEGIITNIGKLLDGCQHIEAIIAGRSRCGGREVSAT